MTTSDLQMRILERLGENPAAPVFYTAADALGVINLGQRIFAFLTLCLEVQRTFQLTAGNQWYALQRTFPDMILVLRCEWLNQASTGADATIGGTNFGLPNFNDQAVTTGAAATPKLQPGTLHQFAAQDNGWYGRAGMPTRYNAVGFGLLTFDRQPDADYTSLVTYARMPVELVNPTDIPEIPEPDHQSLVDLGVGFLRIREGGQELQNEANSIQSFLTAVRRRAVQVRMRSLAQRYDHAPAEIEIPDVSRLLKSRPDLAPNRKGAEWAS
jgi:hypothetical protein